MDWKDQVTSEKNLWQVYKKARSVCSNRMNLWISLIVFALFMGLLTAGYCYQLPILTGFEMTLVAGKIGQLGFTFTTAILGFLIAGFSIFASITRPEIFAALAQLQHKKSDLTRLQFIFFNFLFVFIHYLAFLALSLCTEIFLPVIINISDLLFRYEMMTADFAFWFSGAMVASLMGWFAFLVMLLKSFIWNIYQAVLLVIVTEDLI